MASATASASARAGGLLLVVLGVALASALHDLHAEDGDDSGDADGEYEGDDEEVLEGVCFKRKTPHEKPVASCCVGYQQLNGTATDFGLPRCAAVCAPACVNATCSRPGVCTCLPNHTRRQGMPMHACAPRCSPHCVNALCVGPDVCLCKEGFQPTHLRHVCQSSSTDAHADWAGFPGGLPGAGDGKGRPGGAGAAQQCTTPCGPFQRCVAPNTCTCDEGYAPDPHQPTTCIPACKPPCHPHAFCLANKSCRCIPGYEEDGEGGCAPDCEGGCVNARCVAPGQCECHAGFEKFKDEGDEICVPSCRPPCGAGECVATNNCSCDYGYQLSAEGDCMGICASGTVWNRTLQRCREPWKPGNTTVPFVPLPSQRPTFPPPPPPPPPPPAPSQKPQVPGAAECVPACVHGRCTVRGTCACVRGWTGTDCARPCELRDGSLEFDARNCPELVNCTCKNPAPDGRSCLPGSMVNCEKSAISSKPSPGGEEPPKWLWWAVAGGVVGALVIFVVVPSAVALQRRHKNQPKMSQDRDTLQGKQQRTYTPGSGRAHDQDDQWEFMPS